MKHLLVTILSIIAFTTFGQNEVKSTFPPTKFKRHNPKVNILNNKYRIYSGEILKQVNDTIYLKSGSNILAFHLDEIISIGNQTETFKQERKTDRLFPHKMMVTPSDGFIEKNHVEGNLYMLFFTEIKYAPKDWWNIGGGMSFIPTATSDSTSTFRFSDQFYLFSNKIRFLKRKNFSVFYKSVFFKYPNFEDSITGTTIKIPWQSIHTFAAAFHSKDFHLTVGLSQPYHSDIRRWRAFNATGASTVSSFVLSLVPRVEYFFLVSGAYDVSRSVTLTFENIFYGGAWNTFGNYSSPYRKIGYLPSPGIRIYSHDYSYGGCIMINPNGALPVIPWVEGSYIF